MSRNKVSRNVAQQWAKLTSMDLLAFLLAALLLPTMVGLSRADTWDETLANAKKEGELVAVLGGLASRNYRPIFKIFEDKFGIRTVVSTGSGRTQTDRLLAERGAAQYKVDILMVGPSIGNSRILPNNAADPIKPLLFLPDVLDQTLWYKGKHHYSDVEQVHFCLLSQRRIFTYRHALQYE